MAVIARHYRIPPYQQILMQANQLGMRFYRKIPIKFLERIHLWPLIRFFTHTRHFCFKNGLVIMLKKRLYIRRLLEIFHNHRGIFYQVR